MRQSVWVLVVGIACAGAARADDQGLLRWVDEQTIAIGSLDLGRVDMTALAERFLPVVPMSKEDAARGKDHVRELQQALRDAGASVVYFQYSAAESQGIPAVILPIRDPAAAERLRALLPAGKGSPGTPRPTWEILPGHLVFGLPATQTRLRRFKPAARPDLQAALAGSGTGALRVYLIPSQDSRRVFEELVPTLPKELGGGPVTLLTREMKWASLSAELTPAISGQVVVQTTGPQHAAAVLKVWQAFLSTLAGELRGRGTAVQFALIELFEKLPVQVSGDQVVLKSDGDLAEKVVTSFTRNLAANVAQTLASSNLRQIVIAMHNYHTDYAKLPAQAIRSPEGKPLLSWRVVTLPYIGEEQLYKEFKRDEPWDSEHNQKLIPRMPALYRHPQSPDLPSGQTLFQVFYSKKGMKPGAALLQDGHTTLGMISVADGTSNTFLVTDGAATAVPWTKPDDLLFDPAQPLPKLASPSKDGHARVGFCDGSVRTFRVDADPKLLRQLIGRNDGLNADASEVFK